MSLPDDMKEAWRKDYDDFLYIPSEGDKLIFTKEWQDDCMISLAISAKSEYAAAKMNGCYIALDFPKEISRRVVEYATVSCDKDCYIEFGEKKGNYTPAFSMKFLPSDHCGHVKIEVDIEIYDNSTRAHRCVFYVNSDLGAIERLGRKFKCLAEVADGTEISLR